MTTANTVQYNGNGIVAVFSVPFSFITANDLLVTVTDVTTGNIMPQVLDSDFIVAGGNGGVGSVAMMSSPSNGQQLTITLLSVNDGTTAGADKTEAQMRAAAMLLVIEIALSDIYPERVSSTGSLWDRKIFVRLNDLEHMVIDFAGSEGIRTYMVRATDQGGGEQGITPIADFKVNVNASVLGVQAFIKDLVIITADSVVMDPVLLVNKIAEVANNATRLQAAAQGLEGTVPAPTTYQPT